VRRSGTRSARRRELEWLAASALLAVASGCSSGNPSVAPVDEGQAPQPLPYASTVVSFEPGDDAGFGEDDLPDVVLGPPHGAGTEGGSLDVLSLGKGGSIVLGFEPYAIVDGDGADLVVFENAFWPGGDPSAVFAEPGEVSVSEDGEEWHAFPCDADGDGAGHFAGCAGVTPIQKYAAKSLVPLDPALSGGDAFDLAEVGLERVRFVRIRDRSNAGVSPSAGFDLDAVGIAWTERADAEP
jgi:hypothetical protein